MIETATAYGLELLVPPRDDGVGLCLRESGEFARVELELILDACDGDLLDVGANIGAIGLPFASLRPDSKVVAIEANRKLSQILAANALNNRLSNVEVFHAVAGERSGRIEVPHAPIDRNGNIGMSSIYDKGYPTESVLMRTLDEIHPSNTRLVKIDVEGFEPRVLDGATNLLKSIRPVWLVEVSRIRPNTTALVREKLDHFGYTMYWFFSPFVSPKPGTRIDSRGDFLIYASDSHPPWPMVEVSDDWPTGIEGLPYFSRYGF